MKALQLSFFILKAASQRNVIIQETMYVKPQARSFAHSTAPEHTPIVHTQVYAHNTGPSHTLPAHTQFPPTGNNCFLFFMFPINLEWLHLTLD